MVVKIKPRSELAYNRSHCRFAFYMLLVCKDRLSCENKMSKLWENLTSVNFDLLYLEYIFKYI